jgi:hypothetical protein
MYLTAIFYLPFFSKMKNIIPARKLFMAILLAGALNPAAVGGMFTTIGYCFYPKLTFRSHYACCVPEFIHFLPICGLERALFRLLCKSFSFVSMCHAIPKLVSNYGTPHTHSV